MNMITNDSFQQRDSDTSPLKVLFFGREGCKWSEKIYTTMKDNPNFSTIYIESKGRNENFPEEVQLWEGDYILCFRSLFILPKSILDKAKIAAINFHPGPPEYPGSGCINFALYEGVLEYGVTAHLMNEKVDNGSILQVNRFPILKKDDLVSLLQKTHQALWDLCSDFLLSIDSSDGKSFISEMVENCKHENWKGKPRKIKDL